SAWFCVQSNTLPVPAVSQKPKATPEITPSITTETGPTPRPGTYLVVASFNRETQARSYIAEKTAKKSLSAYVLSGTAKGRTVYRVAVGPVAKPNRPALHNQLTQAGFKGSWPLTLKAPRKIVELASTE
ncbi:MAG: SPOR domain-containing protein, partial [Proteobacteria bacterium]|nr:SPOR domain-containing protein [Pseudomonadota bacterium]